MIVRMTTPQECARADELDAIAFEYKLDRSRATGPEAPASTAGPPSARTAT